MAFARYSATVPMSAVWYVAANGSNSNLTPYPTMASTLMDAATEKVSQIGYVEWDDGDTHTVSSSGGKIHFCTGAVTWATATTNLRVGIQDVTTASNMQPDGTFDVYDDLLQGTETIAANAINTATMSSGAKSIATGALIAVVYDMTVLAGADLVNIAAMDSAGGSSLGGFPYQALYAAAAWAATSSKVPMVLLEADDGHYGWFIGSPFCPALSGMQATAAFNTGTAGADEYGFKFQVLQPQRLAWVVLPMHVASNAADYEVRLFSDPLGTPTTLATTTVDATQSAPSAGEYRSAVPLAYDLAVGTVYGISIRPTTATNVTMAYLDWASGNAAKKASLPFGSYGSLIKRLDNTGAFTEVDYQIPPFILGMAAVSDGAGGGGGLLAHPGMRGGFL